MGSGTTIFSALAQDRNVVGIDMGEEYIDYIETTLLSDGHTRARWEDVRERLLQPATLWDSWAGNKRNFRKPGRAKVE